MKSLATHLVVAFLVASTAHGQSVRVATYNLNCGNRSGDQVLDAITTAKADILCLQETTVQSEQFLKKHLAGRYPEFHSVGHNGQYAAERFVIASTTRPHDSAFHPSGRGFFGFTSAPYRLLIAAEHHAIGRPTKFSTVWARGPSRTLKECRRMAATVTPRCPGGVACPPKSGAAGWRSH